MADTRKFLAQNRKNFNDILTEYTSHESSLERDSLFSHVEQQWILRLAGTHPYLLQLCCYNLLQFKVYMKKSLDIQSDGEKEQLFSLVYEQVGTFPSSTWKRLQEAMQNSSDIPKIEEQFYRFISYAANKYADEQIESSLWDSFDPELRYILYSEGIVRYEPLQPIYFPGTILRDYLVQQAKETRKAVAVPSLRAEQAHSLSIIQPSLERKLVPLSKLEYRLMKTLLEHADHCTEQELIQAGWGETGTERANLTQRLHKIRIKLKEHLDEDIVENRYGGIYSITHPEWLQID